ncbi:glycerol-3-phosphate 1-O-acyltransferase PlsY [Belnapia rosea]|uniref:Glycerol-3-phosphate acyltransferase n=1 Tax=Belnapia rosea TaxID=938405 RepID=A0A1G6MB10_9PROT|nr:glycerol-3-phosphate 1-O-acyltransferase PlsY [Belnapia rosea]SDB43503.1 glycerol-3-phosphate acyltransferase PlsY [Belnapia rosea]SDC52689.1 acyl-phosphate glycerol-3-phosphate acyltransferase [Belnapia rosea]
MNLLLALLLGYLLGSVPWGLLLTRAAGLGDIRAIGSGNIGATNVLRTGNKPLAAATLALDIAKGALALWIAGSLWGEQAGLAAGFGAMLGHAFPVWLGFKGGKGVATGGGVLLAAAWWLGLGAALVWLAVAATLRISSAASLAACAVAPAIALLAGRYDLALFSAGIALLVAIRHRANIERLMAGTEPRIGRK